MRSPETKPPLQVEQAHNPFYRGVLVYGFTQYMGNTPSISRKVFATREQAQQAALADLAFVRLPDGDVTVNTFVTKKLTPELVQKLQADGLAVTGLELTFARDWDVDNYLTVAEIIGLNNQPFSN